MTNAIKTPLNASNLFMGYGGTRFPHVDMRPIASLSRLSRDVNVCSSLSGISRPVDCFMGVSYLFMQLIHRINWGWQLACPPLVIRGDESKTVL
jgi:hypothetical protein